MPNISVVFSVLLICCLSPMLAYLACMEWRGYKAKRATGNISKAVNDYFSRSKMEVKIKVKALCFPGSKSFIVVIDTAPLKRFRYSHIVELSLIHHVESVCGYTVGAVYWRFILPQQSEATAMLDEYAAVGISRAQTHTETKVSDSSWEEFEQARQLKTDSKF